MTVVRSGDTKTFDVQGNHMTGLASPSLGAKETTVFCAQVDPGATSPPHSHDHEEIVMVLEGEADAIVGGERVRIGPKDVLIVPAGTAHAIENPTGAVWTALVAMPQGTRFFRPDGAEVDSPPWTK